MTPNNEIPEMTNPLGRYWIQPAPQLILVDDTHAVMYEQTFLQLAEYSRSMPSGVYAGKMWKARTNSGVWELRWYRDHSDTECWIEGREILILHNALSYEAVEEIAK